MREARRLADQQEPKHDITSIISQMKYVRDGTMWILEAVKDGRYLLQVVRSPTKGCLALVTASGLHY